MDTLSTAKLTHPAMRHSPPLSDAYPCWGGGGGGGGGGIGDGRGEGREEEREGRAGERGEGVGLP